MIAGAVGLITGPDVAFRWSLYLLLAGAPRPLSTGSAPGYVTARTPDDVVILGLDEAKLSGVERKR